MKIQEIYCAIRAEKAFYHILYSTILLLTHKLNYARVDTI